MSRPKGFVTKWSPRTDTRVMIEQILNILYSWDAEDVTPVMNRSVYYKLTTKHGYPKTDEFANIVNDRLTKMRRVDESVLPGLGIDWRLIIDEGVTVPNGRWYMGTQHFVDTIKTLGEEYEIDRLYEQEQGFIVWVEAGGLVAAARKSADKYSVPVVTSGRQDSYYLKRYAAEWIADQGRPVTVFHFGDYDGQGMNIFESLEKDVTAMVDELGGSVEFIRLGVLEEHFEQYNLGTRKAKGTAMDIKYGITTACEADAFDPMDIAGIVEQAIVSRIDIKKYRMWVEIESDQRKKLLEKIEKLT